MAPELTKLDAQDRVILFCVAAGIDHTAVGILPQAMQSMAIRGLQFWPLLGSHLRQKPDDLLKDCQFLAEASLDRCGICRHLATDDLLG